MFQNHVCRFDVVGIDRHQSGDLSINWLQDAFRTDS
jgi:Holliday junction resolvase-like predicted endonuclease